MVTRGFSLRGHRAPIAGFLEIPNGLVSADRDGWIVVWSLVTKRPQGFWKAHDGQIITILSTPHGLLTHGRDSAIRVWNTESLAVETDLALLGRDGLPRPKHEEMPVNALNFCNVDYKDGLLATASTTDSEKFDIYEILVPGKPWGFSRVVQGFSVSSVAVDETKRDGEGIIMKLRFVGRSLLFVGYELGTVKGFRLTDESKTTSLASELLVLNKDLKVTEVFSYNGHSPQPVLSLEYAEEKLYTGSASKKLVIVSVGDLLVEGSAKPSSSEGRSATPSSGLGLLLGRPKIEVIDGFDPIDCPIATYNLRHAGILNIQVGALIHVVFWDGVLKSYTKEMEEVSRSERGEEHIKVESDQTEVAKPTTKALCTYLYHPVQPSTKELSRKELLRFRRAKHDVLLFVGYGDNLISAYTADEL